MSFPFPIDRFQNPVYTKNMIIVEKYDTFHHCVFSPLCLVQDLQGNVNAGMLLEALGHLVFLELQVYLELQG